MTDRFTPTAAGNGASVSVLDGDALDGVLFDRDGTPVVDVPYNSDPDAVVPMPTVRAALALLRRHGLRTGVGRTGERTGRRRGACRRCPRGPVETR
jgi:hypothetical protein